jgi:hypothetical protein
MFLTLGLVAVIPIEPGDSKLHLALCYTNVYTGLCLAK